MKILPASIALSVLLLASLPFVFAGSKPADQPPAPSAPAVSVAPVEEREISEYSEFTGRIEAVDDVEVRARISGHLDAVHFQAGQIVEKGDVLFTIDPRWHQAALSASEAALAQARVRLDNAEREARRAAELRESQAISAEEAESRTSRLAEAQAAVLAADAARSTSSLDLEFTTVRAPVDGRVGRALVTPGNFVSGIPAANTVLTTIVSVDPVFVYADVDEGSMLLLERLMREHALPLDDRSRVLVEVGLSDEEGYPHAGAIESLGNRLDAGTGTLPLRAIVPNADGTLVPGLFARVRVPSSSIRKTPMVPEQAVGTDQSQKFVLVLGPDSTVQYRAVKLGPAIDGLRIVRDGVRAGEEIVVNGLQRVRPGAKVAAEREGVKAAAAVSLGSDTAR
jgi:multidrug efflux system membrane fusion protein